MRAVHEFDGTSDKLDVRFPAGRGHVDTESYLLSKGTQAPKIYKSKDISYLRFVPCSTTPIDVLLYPAVRRDSCCWYAVLCVYAITENVNTHAW